MTTIRALSRDDMEWVARLYARAFGSGPSEPAPSLVESMSEMLFDSPLNKDEFPSLASTDRTGRPLGFLAVHARRFLFKGQPHWGACSGPMVVHPDARPIGSGVFLLRRFLRGPQAFSFTDGAVEDVRRLWEGMGGIANHLSCVRWSKVFRPIGLARLKVRHGRFGRFFSVGLALGRPLFLCGDGFARLLPATGLKPSAPDIHGEELTVANLLEGLSTLAGGYLVKPVYDEVALGWLFSQMRKAKGRGTLCGHLLRDTRGNPIGWYLYYRKRLGLSKVVQIAATPVFMSQVLSHLFHDADRGGSLALQGRVEPALLAPLGRAGVLLHYTDPFTLVHSRDFEMFAALTTGRALWTRMEGDWWMGSAIEGLASS